MVFIEDSACFCWTSACAKTSVDETKSVGSIFCVLKVSGAGDSGDAGGKLANASVGQIVFFHVGRGSVSKAPHA